MLTKKEHAEAYKRIFGDNIFRSNTPLTRRENVDGICLFTCENDEVTRYAYFDTGITKFLEVTPMHHVVGGVSMYVNAYIESTIPDEYKDKFNILKEAYSSKEKFILVEDRFELYHFLIEG